MNRIFRMLGQPVTLCVSLALLGPVLLSGCAPIHEPLLNAAGDQVKRGATAARYFAGSTFHTVDIPYVQVSAGPPPSFNLSLWHIVNNPPPALLTGTLTAPSQSLK